MSSTSAERQRKHKERMREQNLSLVQVWVPKDRILEIKSIAARMVEEGSQDPKPSQRQLDFAQFLCDKKGLKVNQEVLSSSKRLSEWLNNNKKKSQNQLVRLQGFLYPLLPSQYLNLLVLIFSRRNLGISPSLGHQ